MRVNTLNDSIPLFEIILMQFTYSSCKTISVSCTGNERLYSRGCLYLSSEYKTGKRWSDTWIIGVDQNGTYESCHNYNTLIVCEEIPI